jgi:hypothetical protein
MNILKIIGALIFIVGIVDIGGNFMDFDLWGTIGVQLPDVIWKYSGYIELILGGFLFNLGSGDKEEEAES